MWLTRPSLPLRPGWSGCPGAAAEPRPRPAPSRWSRWRWQADVRGGSPTVPSSCRFSPRGWGWLRAQRAGIPGRDPHVEAWTGPLCRRPPSRPRDGLRRAFFAPLRRDGMDAVVPATCSTSPRRRVPDPGWSLPCAPPRRPAVRDASRGPPRLGRLWLHRPSRLPSGPSAPRARRGAAAERTP